MVDFSRKRQSKKGSIARSKGSSPKGFVPKSPIGGSSKKNTGVKKGDSLASIVSEISGEGNKQTLDVHIDDDDDNDDKNREVELSQDENFEVVVSRTKEYGGEIENIHVVDEGVVGVLKSQEEEGTSYIEDVGIVKDSEGSTLEYEEIEENVEGINADTDGEVNGDVIEETSTATDDRVNEEASRLLKLKLEESLRKQEIEKIAEENLLQGTRMFVYPPVVKPDQDIEVFLNKSLSTLSDEPDILMLGAFNDWRWKSFTIRLNETHLKDDWWSCQLHVPREAYKVDFVFFNGQNEFDNNDQKDFCLPVSGGMDALAFEEFLLEEKRKELEKLAMEEAERERQAEEQRRIEADKAAKEEDMLQARAEVEKRRETLLQLMKNALKSIDDVWYIEPSEFKGKDLVRLYYNANSGPLKNAKELWIHGGHNSWKDGLSIVERLVQSVLKGGNWWYADGMLLTHLFVIFDFL